MRVSIPGYSVTRKCSDTSNQFVIFLGSDFIDKFYND